MARRLRHNFHVVNRAARFRNRLANLSHRLKVSRYASWRNCLGMYLKYGDTKMSDLTYSQAKQIQFCDSRGLYHDLQ